MKGGISRSRLKFVIPFLVLLILLGCIGVTIMSSAYSEFTGEPAPISPAWLSYSFKSYNFTYNPTGYEPGSDPWMAQNATLSITSGSILMLSVIPLAVYSFIGAKEYVADAQNERAGVRRL
jgi:hypothetical protein